MKRIEPAIVFVAVLAVCSECNRGVEVPELGDVTGTLDCKPLEGTTVMFEPQR